MWWDEFMNITNFSDKLEKFRTYILKYLTQKHLYFTYKYSLFYVADGNSSDYLIIPGFLPNFKQILRLANIVK